MSEENRKALVETYKMIAQNDNLSDEQLRKRVESGSSAYTYLSPAGEPPIIFTSRLLERNKISLAEQMNFLRLAMATENRPFVYLTVRELKLQPKFPFIKTRKIIDETFFSKEMKPVIAS